MKEFVSRMRNCKIARNLFYRYKDIWKSKPHSTEISNEKGAQRVLSIDSNEISVTVHSRNLNLREVKV